MGAYESVPEKPTKKKMGCGSSKIIYDKFTTLAQITDQLRLAGLESCDMIIGVDYTASNDSSGKSSFGGRSLHYLGIENPYQHVMSTIVRTLDRFDDDKQIPVFGFGDLTTRNEKVFPLSARPDYCCNGLDDVLAHYTRTTPYVTLSGPTSFAPLIKTAVNIVKRTGRYHILLIITDGVVSSPDYDAEAIVEASRYGLSIVCIGFSCVLTCIFFRCVSANSPRIFLLFFLSMSNRNSLINF